MAHIKTKKQLKKLFHDERITVCEGLENSHSTTEYIIPINKRVYVIEDIDAVESGVLLRRTEKKTVEKKKPQKGEFTSSSTFEDTTDDIDLTTILNIIDGTLEMPGRILIISSNYPEKLDDALIRPGRIDMLIEYKKCNHYVLEKMYTSFYGIVTDVPMEKIEAIPEYKWSPAEVIQCMFRHVNNPEEALEYMATVDPFKFDVPQEDPVDETLVDGSSSVDGDSLLLPESEESKRQYGTFLTAKMPPRNDGTNYKMVNTDAGPKYVPVENKTSAVEKDDDSFVIKPGNHVEKLYNTSQPRAAKMLETLLETSDPTLTEPIETGGYNTFSDNGYAVAGEV